MLFSFIFYEIKQNPDLSNLIMLLNEKSPDEAGENQIPLPKNLILQKVSFSRQNMESDVVIIGGGISGALTAYFLTEAGIESTLLDGRTVGLGSTCASTSLLQY